MKNQLISRGLPLLVVGLFIAACEKDGVNGDKPPVATRGEFGVESCNVNERVAVDSAAVYAIYVDENGNPVGPGPMGLAEDLTGTNKNLMCPTPGEEPGACPTGYCQRLVSGKTYCLRC